MSGLETLETAQLGAAARVAAAFSGLAFVSTLPLLSVRRFGTETRGKGQKASKFPGPGQCQREEASHSVSGPSAPRRSRSTVCVRYRKRAADAFTALLAIS